ncbi:hypothetical protein [uncultured Thiocystis sp.]|jgi:hypothetical protein|uniref:hypothetical protein n=1 Tax=uncultured Thiocystis sp. TaxID=1202134 RepID=UPI0025EC17D1|nr:hypothetical protein [uncultured Thiocystis sp.]
MTKYFSILLAGCLALASFGGHSAAYSYSMKISTSKPKGSAADAVAKNKNLPSATPFSPCTVDKVDALSFQLIYDAGKADLDATSPTQDVYVFFYNPSALGADPSDPPLDTATAPAPVDYPYVCEKADGSEVFCDPKIWAVVRTTYNFNRIALEPLVDVDDIDAVDHIYLTAWENLGGAITDILLRSYVAFDGIQTGIWGLVGIIADNALVDFKDATTWTAWDVETFALGAPWRDAVSTSLTPGFCEQ